MLSMNVFHNIKIFYELAKESSVFFKNTLSKINIHMPVTSNICITT